MLNSLGLLSKTRLYPNPTRVKDVIPYNQAFDQKVMKFCTTKAFRSFEAEHNLSVVSSERRNPQLSYK